MRTRPTILFFGPVGEPVPDLVREWALGRSFPLEIHADAAQVESILLRGHPCLLFIDGDRMGQAGLQLVRDLKSDPFTAIMNNQKWNIGQLNDFFAEWAMHNITWDYQDPAPESTAGGNQGALFRSNYGLPTDTSKSATRFNPASNTSSVCWADFSVYHSP